MRVDGATGAPAAGNPFPDNTVYTLGHRNVQGLAIRPDTGEIYAVEQGTHRDDEVNRLTPGGNYGWNRTPATASTTNPSQRPTPTASPRPLRRCGGQVPRRSLPPAAPSSPAPCGASGTTPLRSAS
nr:PQQ-dependent sugar dehydrogenase [Rhodococcus sp. WB9]